MATPPPCEIDESATYRVAIDTEKGPIVLEGSGRGGPCYKSADEPVKSEYTLGAVAMANAGPDTNGSQFFVCIDDCTRKLDKAYNLFGYVIEGIETTQQ